MEFVKPPLPRGNAKQDTTTGKNLANDNDMLPGYWAYADGAYIKTNTWICTPKIACKGNEDYTFQFANNSRWYGFVWYDENNNFISMANQQNNLQTGFRSFTAKSPSNAGYLAINIAGYPGTNDTIRTDDLINFQLEEGPTATSYEPYTGGIPSPNPDYPQEIRNVTGDVEVVVSNSDSTKSHTFTFPLGNEKLMLGDYLADDGIHHLKKQIVLNGTENWAIGFHGTNSYQLRIIGIKYPLSTYDTKVFIKSSHFRGIPITNRLTSGDNVIYLDTSPTIYIRNTSFTSISDFKTWLSTNNVTIEYELANEEITPYTAEQQQVYNLIKKALSYEEQTNISGSSGESNPIFDVEAYQSTKLILENLDSRLTLVEG